MSSRIAHGIVLVARRLGADQRGMTIVEGAMACLLLALGALATMQVFDAATRASYGAEERQSINNRLQAELEELKQLPYAELAMESLPVDSSDQNDPRWRMIGSDYAIASNGSQLKPVVVDATNGAVSAAPEPFTVGDVGGQIFKFVVWRDDPGCPEALCPGSQDMKRVIVAAKITEAPVSYERDFHEIHGDVVDPDVTPVDNPAPGPPVGGGPGNPPNPNNPPDPDDGTTTAEFWLTDTPCGAPWQRQPIVADHLTHNTRDVCDTGLKTGSTPGAPDLMFNEAPELDPAYPVDAQPLFDYATDVEPAVNPGLDKGLALRRGTQNGCLLDGGTTELPLLDLHSPLETSKHEKVHKWVSEPMPQDFELLLLGHGTLELWTRTVNGASYPGKVCAWLYVRKVIDGVLVDVTIDTPVITTLGSRYFTYAQNPWPANWTPISVDLSFVSPPTILEGEQIGLALTVERPGTTQDALEFMYDHPSFESRLQLATDRFLPL
jgi:hypothetical protein